MNGFDRGCASALLSAIVALYGTGCGPTTFVQERMVFESPSAKEAKQSRGGLTVERQKVVDLPPEFSAMAPACNPLTGQPAVDFQGSPQLERVSLIPAGAIVEKLAIANNTSHIVRLRGAVIAMFDPADNQYEALDRDQVASLLGQQHPCAGALGFVNSLKLVKSIDRNSEILPNRSVSGYIFFSPAQQKMPGIWKLSLYEVPVRTNSAGDVTETVQFDFRTEAKRYRDVYQRDSLVAPPRLVRTDEVK